LYIIKRNKSTSSVHILGRNCLLKHVIEGRIEGRMKVRGRKKKRKLKKLLNECKETRGYWKLKESALDRALWKASFGRILERLWKKIYNKISTCKFLVMLIVSYVAGLQLLHSKIRVPLCFSFLESY